VPGGQQRIATIDTSATGRALVGLGQTVEKLADAQAEKQDRYDYARAKTEWIKARANAESEFEGDKDYGTIEDRYRGALSQKMPDVGNVIRNRGLREQFSMEMEADLEVGASKMKAHAWDIEKDHHRGLLVDDLKVLRDAALQSNSAESIAAMQERIDAASEIGYLSDTEAAKMRQDNTAEYAIARVGMLPAGQRLKMLDSPLGKFIPADKAQQIRESAKNELVDDTAMYTADIWTQQGLSLTEGMAEARKIKDPDVRKATEQRFQLQYRINEQAEQDGQNDLYQDYSSQIENGDITYDGIPRSTRDQMTAVQRRNLRGLYEEKATGTKVKTDIAVYDQLNVLLQSDQPKQARQYFLDNYQSLSESDRKSYSKLTSAAVNEDPEAKTFMTNKQYLKHAADMAGIRGDNASKLDQQLMDWYEGYVQANGKAPDNQETQRAVDQLLLKRPDTGFLGFGEERVFELPTAPADLLLSAEPERNVTMVREAFVKRFDREPSSAELLKYYMQNKEKGKFDGR
jgi:hypothetical protein